ncbi:ABC transporter ATP-binding protein [Riemerella anatipestifer]|uniref:ABC transporter ATP-binding protein n=3 Tax=Riemerella anatipestifer TaxID=34085 RepID=A0AAP6HDI3_RIEAN|nr:ABC transporter ATP-binding protein [Riemerella anatipestifer]MCD5969007.1 ABC transporter ATP-binding protein/permease [Riemerella anatipestifer]MCU7539480.1 ABC transporter ATP-binding protein/permease [Riemerella anatipestifer]MCU7569549.1 ABC transporter ATP-binding protein/permease [Riemerella anatipestifer]MCU7596810.1 ABC transporter ATP-binding protein/permease [Riemerella anatipestifer]MCW0487697.1 ABC transporter ATP-binding protein/permease [Riemerella anatipestifer]
MDNKENRLTHFKYFKGIVGWHIYGYAVLNFLVGLLDGLGLAMFVPLLSIASGELGDSQSLGRIKYFIDFLQSLGVEINLVNALFVMIVLFLLKGIFYYCRSIYFAKIRLGAISKLRLDLIKKLHRLSYVGFTKMEVGRIQNTMIGELGRLIGALTNYFSTMQNIIMLLTYVILAFLSNWKFAILVAIGGIFSNFIYKYINDYTKSKSRELSSKTHDFNDFLVQVLHNFKYLKATNYFNKYSKNLIRNIKEQEQLNFNMGKVGAIGESIREPMIISIISVVIIIQIAYFENAFSSIIVSLLLFYRGLGHLVTLQNVWNNFLGNSAGIESFNRLLLDFTRYEEPQSDVYISSIDDIDVKNLNLSFDRTPILKNINIRIKKNSSIALVGESGAGKTTLANVISGLQMPDEGEVLAGTKSVYHSNLNSYRSRIGYITQEPVIFNDSVYNNITFWDEKSQKNTNRFFDVIDKVSLKDFLITQNKKEDAILGNNGILISGGQKQRISIARELYKNIDLLIMDEATSALDSETEMYIKESIDALQGNLTLVIIAHRLSTIKEVDEIYLMEKGKIVAQGSFKKLYEISDKFRRMVDLQEVLGK